MGGKWFSAQELRAGGRRVTDGLGRGDVGICPACGASRLGATDGPGSFQFPEGSECFHCGHVATADTSTKVDRTARPHQKLRSLVNPEAEDSSRRILLAEGGNGEAVEPLDDEVAGLP